MSVDVASSENPATSTGYDSVQFSRTQGVFSASALGGNIVLGIGTFVAGAQIINQSGSDTPLVFFVAGILFLPLILSCIQRSSGAISGAGFYAAARGSGSAFRLFFSVWLMLAGYLTVGALLAYAAGSRVAVGLDRVLGWKIGNEIPIYIIIASVFIKELITQKESWRGRTAVFWCCVIFLISLLIWGYVAHFRQGARMPKTEAIQHWLFSVSILASTLWSIDIVLNYRSQFRRPTRTTAFTLFVILLGGNLLSALIAVQKLRNPSLLMQNWLSVLTWNESRLEMLILIAGFLICVSGLLRVTTRITRLLGSMIYDGALPKFHYKSAESNKSLHIYQIFIYSGFIILSTTLSTNYLLLVSAMSALLSVILYLYPLIRKDVSRLTKFSLPLHPLIPAMAIVISIFLMWILPLEDLLFIGSWLFLGSVLYYTTSRKKMLPAMQQERTLAGQGAESARAKYCVLACMSTNEVNEGLLRVGAALAEANNGELVVLQVLESSELTPGTLQRKNGEEEWLRIRVKLDKTSLAVHPIPVVRIAPDFISGVWASSREFEADFILMEWPEERAERLRKGQLQNTLQMTARPVGIFKGDFQESGGQISVACGNSAHTQLAFRIAESVATMYDSRLQAIRIVSKTGSNSEALEAIEKAMRQSNTQMQIERAIEQDTDIQKGILRVAGNSDLLVIGVSDDPLSGRALPDGPSIDIAQKREQATLVVKCQEEVSRFFIRRMLGQVTSRVAPLTPKERGELLAQLKVGLQARTDFYLMVALAAAIAIIGLIMNDGSIVLGAMLVSPLMSPIVGIACGIALGNLDLMRRSGASTFKGMAVVLGMGVVMTFILPDVQPTQQILARTTPGIFDLLAALAAGAAGAYSLGRKSVAGAIPGVAMSLSLEPPLATAGYGLTTSQFWITGGAFLLFLTNLAAIVLSGVGVYLLLGMRPTRRDSLYVVGKALGLVSLVILLLIIPLGFGTYGVIQRGHLKYQVEKEFRKEAFRERFELLDLKIAENEAGFLIEPTVLASEEITSDKIEKFRKAVEAEVGSPIQIEATILQSKRLESPKPERPH